jgi:hypothetical protein
MSPDDQTSNPGEAGPSVAAGSAARRLPLISPPAARERPAAALIPQPGSNAVVWTTGIAQLPRGQAVALLTCVAHAPVATTLDAW